MNNSFGIDHPLIAVREIEVVRERMLSLGFRMTPLGKHPWGTSNTLAMFDGCLIEIMGVYDESLLDVNPAGSFHFGRHVHTHLLEREGVALSALHSTDIDADIKRAKECALNVSGQLEFGRDVALPAGGTGRTKTSLALMPDLEFPRLSFFLCQQHRPDLIYVPEWMDHPNTVTGIRGVTIMAKAEDHERLRLKFSAIYGDAKPVTGGFRVETANGYISVQTVEAIEHELGSLPDVVLSSSEAGIVAMDFNCTDLAQLERFVESSGQAYRTGKDWLLLTDSTQTGNTYFRFFQS